MNAAGQYLDVVEYVIGRLIYCNYVLSVAFNNQLFSSLRRREKEGCPSNWGLWIRQWRRGGEIRCADPLALGNPLETISLADRQTD